MYSWEEFEALVGCAIGSHSDDPEVAKTQFYQSSTVAHADSAIKKANLAELKTAADFNREQEEKK